MKKQAKTKPGLPSLMTWLTTGGATGCHQSGTRLDLRPLWSHPHQGLQWPGLYHSSKQY